MVRHLVPVHMNMTFLQLVKFWRLRSGRKPSSRPRSPHCSLAARRPRHPLDTSRNVIKHIREPALVISEAPLSLSAPGADEDLTQLFYALLSEEDLEGALGTIVRVTRVLI